MLLKDFQFENLQTKKGVQRSRKVNSQSIKPKDYSADDILN